MISSLIWNKIKKCSHPALIVLVMLVYSGGLADALMEEDAMMISGPWIIHITRRIQISHHELNGQIGISRGSRIIGVALLTQLDVNVAIKSLKPWKEGKGMTELYRIHHRIGRAMSTGNYEITRNGNRRAITKYSEVYKTDAGEFSPEQWRAELSKAIEVDKESDVLEVIIDHCREHCAWLHKEADILDYAMDILSSRAFLCGNECWKDVADKVKDKYFLFKF